MVAQLESDKQHVNIEEKKMNSEPLLMHAMATSMVDEAFRSATKLSPGANTGALAKETGFKKTRQLLSSQSFKYEYYMGLERTDGKAIGWHVSTCQHAPPSPRTTPTRDRLL